MHAGSSFSGRVGEATEERSGRSRAISSPDAGCALSSLSGTSDGESHTARVAKRHFDTCRYYHRNDMHRKVSIRRAYEDPGRNDGYRVLVDRIWPRGRRKEELALDEWAKDLAPSTALRKWFGHDPERWEGFRERYRNELATPEARERLRALVEAAGERPLTLVYSAKDEQHNQAVVLREAIARLGR
jgi:uncharacterized protein YeaO (DUF488 family)